MRDEKQKNASRDEILFKFSSKFDEWARGWITEWEKNSLRARDDFFSAVT